MLLTKIINNLDLIKKYKNKIRFLLLIIGTLALKISFTKNKVLTSQSLYNKIQPIRIYRKTEDFSEKLKYLQPNDTILVIVKEKEYFRFKSIVNLIRKRILRTKRIKLIIDTGNIDSLPSYFCILKLEFSNFTSIKIYPFRNSQPNSDLLFIAQYFFSSKLIFNIDLFHKNLCNVNTFEIQLTPSNKSLTNLYMFIKSIDNLHSHSLGTYYYFPFVNQHLNLINLLPFLLLNIVYNLFSGLDNGFDIGFKYFAALLYYYTPLVMVFYLKKDYLLNGSCLALFSLFNFKMGFVYGVIVWIRNVIYFFVERI